MTTLIARLQQENDRLTTQCHRFQTKLAQLRQENERLRQAEANSRQAPRLSTVAQVANLLLRSPDYTTVLPDGVRLLGEVEGAIERIALQ